MSPMQLYIDTFPAHYSQGTLGFLLIAALAAAVMALGITLGAGMRPARLGRPRRRCQPPHGKRPRR